MKKITLTLFVLSFAICISYAQSGTLDNTFGTGGKVTTNFGNGQDGGVSVVIQSDGKIVVAGTTNNGSPNYSDFALVRYNTNGSLDNIFSSGGKTATNFGSGTNDVARSVALQSDGKIVVAGSSDTSFALARYNNNGSLDNTFGAGGKVVTYAYYDLGYSVAIQSDGKIIMAGWSYVSVSTRDFGLERYNSNGSLDNTFGTGGKVITAVGGVDNFCCSIAIQNDGKIVMTGGTGNFVTVRYNNTGSLDNTFGSGGIVSTYIGTGCGSNSVAIQSDGKIVVLGSSSNNSGSDFTLVRYNTNGSLDNTFGSAGEVTTAFGGNYNSGISIVIQTDGKIVMAGSTCPNSAPCNIALLRYNTDGSLDNSFGLGGIDTTDFGMSESGNSVAMQSDGKIVVAGSSAQQNYSVFAIARYNNIVLNGIAESNNNNELELKISPNPSSGIFTVNMHNCKDAKICVYDVLGSCLLEKSCRGETIQEINLSCQPRGIYFVELLSGEERVVKKVAVQ